MYPTRNAFHVFRPRGTNPTRYSDPEMCSQSHPSGQSYFGDLQPLTVGAWIISSRALKPSSCPEELTTTNPILWGILHTWAVHKIREEF